MNTQSRESTDTRMRHDELLRQYRTALLQTAHRHGVDWDENGFRLAEPAGRGIRGSARQNALLAEANAGRGRRRAKGADDPLRDAEILTELVWQAARGERNTRVFPVEHEHGRTWVISGPNAGSVTYWDTSNRWCQIIHVEMNDEQRTEFWRDLRRLVRARPRSTHRIRSQPAGSLLQESGFYSPGTTPER